MSAKQPRALGTLAGLAPVDAQRLETAGLGTAEALVEHVAEHGLAATSARANPPVPLQAPLTPYVLAEARGEARPRRVRAWNGLASHWADGLVGLLGLAVLVLGVRALLAPEQVAVARRTLRAFEVVDTADVTVRRVPAGFRTAKDAGAAAGRLVLRDIPANAPIPLDRLSPVRVAEAAELRGRRVLSVPVPPHALSLAVQGSRVELAFSPIDPAVSPPSPVRDAIVLRTQAAGDTASILVAVRGADVPAVVRGLASSQVIVLQQPREVIRPPRP